MKSEETERAKEIDQAVKSADARKRKDAEEEDHNGEKLDVILSHLDALGKRMDQYDAEMAEHEEAGGPERKPVEEAGEFEKLGMEQGKPRPLGADSARMDSEEIGHFKRETGSPHAIPIPFSRTFKPRPTAPQAHGGKMLVTHGMAKVSLRTGAALRASIKLIRRRGGMWIWQRYRANHCATPRRRFSPTPLPHVRRRKATARLCAVSHGGIVTPGIS